MGKMLLMILCIGIIYSCDTNEVYSDYKSLPDYWDKENTIEFTLPEMDTLATYNLYINIRNTNQYRYNNLFLITSMHFPHGKVVTDTLEYQMAYPDGTWMGTGSTVKENKLWYRENIRFFEKGDYILKLRHAMRNNASVSGVKELEGITDVGVSMEKVNTGSK